MKLTEDQVRKVAKLANLPVSAKEVEVYSDQLSKILDYIDQLNEVNTDGVEPTYNVSGLNNVWAHDEAKESLSPDEATKNASNIKEGFLVTKGVFADE